MNPSFEEILRAWLLEYDDRLPNDKTERREAILVLFGNLTNYGYDKEQIKKKRETIIKRLVNPNHPNKQKLKRWVDMIVNDLEAALLIYFGTVKIDRNVVTQEMRDKLENINKREKEVKQLKTEGSQVPEEETEVFNISDAIDKYPEITEEMLNQVESPNVIIDEEFAKHLGLESDE